MMRENGTKQNQTVWVTRANIESKDRKSIEPQTVHTMERPAGIYTEHSSAMTETSEK